MKIIKTTFLSFLLLTIITSCSNDNSLKNNLSNEGKLVNYFSTSIHSKKYQVVHLGTLIEENKNEIPHALLIKFNAKRNGWWFSKEYTLNDIELLISKFTEEDHNIIITSASYSNDDKKITVEAKIDSTSNKKTGNPLDSKSNSYLFKDEDLKFKNLKKIVLTKGTILDFHINFDGIPHDKETPEIECKLRIN